MHDLLGEAAPQGIHCDTSLRAGDAGTHFLLQTTGRSMEIEMEGAFQSRSLCMRPDARTILANVTGDLLAIPAAYFSPTSRVSKVGDVVLDPVEQCRRNLRGKRIMIVEDEILIAMELEMSLQDAGSDVVGPFTELAQADSIQDRSVVDAALLDVNLNGDVVYPLADRLQQMDVPLVFYTGNADYHVLEDRYPNAAIIKKPADPDALLDVLSKSI